MIIEDEEKNSKVTKISDFYATNKLFSDNKRKTDMNATSKLSGVETNSFNDLDIPTFLRKKR